MHQDDDYTHHTSLEAFPTPSKSQRKREATALQLIGQKLVTLKPVQLAKIPLPNELLEAILSAQGIRQHGARQRQLQYIGKLMRQLDADPICTALQALESSSATAKRQQHYLENLCTALVAGEEQTLADFLSRCPSVDRQYLRRLVRNAARERELGKPPRHRRALFRYLRQQLAAACC